MNQKIISRLAGQTRTMSPEDRLKAVAAAITGRPATLAWETKPGGTANVAGPEPRGSLFMIATVRSGGEKWALAGNTSHQGVKEHIVVVMTTSLIHEVAGCNCPPRGAAPCPAFLAFIRAVEGQAAA